MDKIAQAANRARSKRGGKFEEKLVELFEVLKRENKIKEYERNPSIFDGEFNPDFIVVTNKAEVVCLDATTTARTDRLRAKQWDAHGTKQFYRETQGIEIKAYTVVQDTDTSEREVNNFRLCKRRCQLPHSALDGTISVDDMVRVLTS
jgi:hypothetical protein